jgi:hypothetical protein
VKGYIRSYPEKREKRRGKLQQLVDEEKYYDTFDDDLVYY